jgi:hypothetical protein
MPDNELSQLLLQARQAAQRMDTSRAALAFETRMGAVLRQQQQAAAGPVSRFHTWLRATIGFAAATGVFAFLFLTTRPAVEMEDTLTAWFSGGSTAWDMELFN